MSEHTEWKCPCRDRPALVIWMKKCIDPKRGSKIPTAMHLKIRTCHNTRHKCTWGIYKLSAIENAFANWQKFRNFRRRHSPLDIFRTWTWAAPCRTGRSPGKKRGRPVWGTSWRCRRRGSSSPAAAPTTRREGWRSPVTSRRTGRLTTSRLATCRKRRLGNGRSSTEDELKRQFRNLSQNRVVALRQCASFVFRSSGVQIPPNHCFYLHINQPVAVEALKQTASLVSKRWRVWIPPKVCFFTYFGYDPEHTANQVQVKRTTAESVHKCSTASMEPQYDRKPVQDPRVEENVFCKGFCCEGYRNTVFLAWKSSSRLGLLSNKNLLVKIKTRLLGFISIFILHEWSERSELHEVKW